MLSDDARKLHPYETEAELAKRVMELEAVLDRLAEAARGFVEIVALVRPQLLESSVGRNLCAALASLSNPDGEGTCECGLSQGNHRC